MNPYMFVNSPHWNPVPAHIPKPPKGSPARGQPAKGDSSTPKDSAAQSTKMTAESPHTSAPPPSALAKHRMGLMGGRRRRSTLTGSDPVPEIYNALERQQTPDPPAPAATDSTGLRRDLDHDLDEPLSLHDSKDNKAKGLFGFMMRKSTTRDTTHSASTHSSDHSSHGHRHAPSHPGEDEPVFMAGPSRAAQGRNRPRSIKSMKDGHHHHHDDKPAKVKMPKPPKAPKPKKLDYLAIGRGIGGDVQPMTEDKPMIGMGIGGDVGVERRVPVAPPPSIKSHRRGLMSSNSSSGSTPSLTSMTTAAASVTSPSRERGFSLLTVASSTDSPASSAPPHQLETALHASYQPQGSSSAHVTSPSESAPAPAEATSPTTEALLNGADLPRRDASLLGPEAVDFSSGAYSTTVNRSTLAPLTSQTSHTTSVASQATSHTDPDDMDHLFDNPEGLSKSELRKKLKQEKKEQKEREKKEKKAKERAERAERWRILREEDEKYRAQYGYHNNAGMAGMAGMGGGMAAWSFTVAPSSAIPKPKPKVEPKAEEAKVEAAAAERERQAQQPPAAAGHPTPSPQPASPNPQSPSSPKRGFLDMSRAPAEPTSRAFSLARRPFGRRRSASDPSRSFNQEPEFDGPMVVISAEPQNQRGEESDHSAGGLLERMGSYAAKFKRTDESTLRRLDPSDNEAEMSSSPSISPAISPSLSTGQLRTIPRKASNTSSRLSRLDLDDEVFTFMNALETTEQHDEDVEQILARAMPDVPRECRPPLAVPAPVSISKRRRELAMSPMRVEMPNSPNLRFFNGISSPEGITPGRETAPSPSREAPFAPRAAPDVPSSPRLSYSPALYAHQPVELISQPTSPHSPHGASHRSSDRNSGFSQTMPSPRTPRTPHTPHSAQSAQSPHATLSPGLAHSSHSNSAPHAAQGSYFPTAPSLQSYFPPTSSSACFTGQPHEPARSRTSVASSYMSHESDSQLHPARSERPEAYAAGGSHQIPVDAPMPPPSAPLPPLPPNARVPPKSPRSLPVAAPPTYALPRMPPLPALVLATRAAERPHYEEPSPNVYEEDSSPLPESPTIPDFGPEPTIDFSRAPDDASDVSDATDVGELVSGQHCGQPRYEPAREPVRDRDVEDDQYTISRTISHDPLGMYEERCTTPMDTRRYSRPLCDDSPTLPRERPLSDISPTLPYSPTLGGYDLAYLNNKSESTISSFIDGLYDIPISEGTVQLGLSGTSTPRTSGPEGFSSERTSPASATTETLEQITTPPTDEGSVFDFTTRASSMSSFSVADEDHSIRSKLPTLLPPVRIPAIDIESALSTPATATFARAETTPGREAEADKDQLGALGRNTSPKIGERSPLRSASTPTPAAHSPPSQFPHRAGSPTPSGDTGRPSSPNDYRRSSSSTRSRSSSARSPSPEPTLDEFMATFRNMKGAGGLSIREAVRRAEQGTGFGV